MLNFLIPKTQVQAFNYSKIPIEHFDVLGIGQINPYCSNRFENEIFITSVNIILGLGRYDGKEGLVLSEYFTVRKCPHCKRVKLIPTKIRINLDQMKNDTDFYDDFEGEMDTAIYAYCNSCSSCFYFDIKEKDLWVKEARKLKEKSLITGKWEMYSIE